MAGESNKTCWDCLAEILQEHHAQTLADSLRLTQMAQMRMRGERSLVTRKGDDARRRRD